LLVQSLWSVSHRESLPTLRTGSALPDAGVELQADQIEARPQAAQSIARLSAPTSVRRRRSWNHHG
jgi:hypothetical protein